MKPTHFPPLPPLRRRPMLGLAILLAASLTLLALIWTWTSPASAADGYEPDATVVENVETYSKELNHGYDHVLRWMRVLMTLGAVQGMTADQAQENADKYSADRWDPVVEELTALEADDGHEPDATVVENVETYSKELNHGYDHVLRWMRVLMTLGAVQGMTADQAQENADKYSADRWDPVVEELRKLEQDDGATGSGGGPSGQDDGGAEGQQGCGGPTLSVNRTGPHAPGDDPANPHPQYVAVLSWSYPSGCADGGIQILWKAPGETNFAEFGRMPDTTRTFRMGFWPSADAGTHAFHLGAWDQHGTYHLSNQVTVDIPAAPTPTPVPTPAPHPGEGGNKPYDLRAWADNAGGFNLDWEAPTLATGRVLTAYVINYQKGTEATVTLTLDTATYVALYTQRRIYGDDINAGSQYRARVKARHTAADGTDSQDTGWTSWTDSVQTWEEPLKVWFIDNTPNYNQQIGRLFMMVDTSHANSSAVCVIRSGQEINCPPRTLTSLNVHNPGGGHNVGATAYAGDRIANVPQFEGRPKSAPPPPIRVSGGDGSLYVGWDVPHTLRSAQCHPHAGNLAGFKVQYRRMNNDGSWPDWSDANSVTKGGSVGLYRVKSYGGDGASVVWDLQEEGDTLPQANGSSGNYRGVYSSFEDLPLTGNTGGDVALVSSSGAFSSGAFYRWVRAVGTDPHWALDERPTDYLGSFNSEYAAGQEVSARLQYASFVSREHTWTGLASGTYQARVAAVGDGEDCHDGTHFHDNGRGFWSRVRGVEVGTSQAPGKVTNPSLEREGGRVAVTWDNPSADGDSNSWALIRYRPVGGDPDAYEYTYVPGVPSPKLIGLHFHEVTRICRQGAAGEIWRLHTETEGGASSRSFQTCTNPRRVEFNVDSGKLYEVGIAAINANGVSDWHDFPHFWYGPS